MPCGCMCKISLSLLRCQVPMSGHFGHTSVGGFWELGVILWNLCETGVWESNAPRLFCKKKENINWRYGTHIWIITPVFLEMLFEWLFVWFQYFVSSHKLRFYVNSSSSVVLPFFVGFRNLQTMQISKEQTSFSWVPVSSEPFTIIVLGHSPVFGVFEFKTTPSVP
jgi:hypothetical protein